MRIILSALIYSATIFLMASCNGNTGKTTSGPDTKANVLKLSEALIDGDLVYDASEKIFSGEIWSDDMKTFCMVVKNGVISDVKTFHENGQLAILNHTADGNDLHTYYDENGKEMTEDAFNAKYQSVWDRMEAAWPED